MLENLIATLKADPRTIVFTEGPDPRILEAASRLKKDGILTSILIGNVDEVKAAAEKCGFDIEGIECLDWTDDGAIGGPVRAGGAIGLRQMAPLIAEYSDLLVEAI